MKIVVIDLEMNQPSGRVFQIAGVLCNLKEKEPTSTFNVYCKLPETDPLTPEIAKLCNVTSERLSTGDSLEDGIVKFWNWFKDCNCGGRISAWGSDVLKLKQQSINLGIQPPEKLYNLNIKEMGKFIRTACGGKYKGGLLDYLNYFGLNFIGAQHDALTDSVNTARLLIRWAEMLGRYSLMERTFSKVTEKLND